MSHRLPIENRLASVVGVRPSDVGPAAPRFLVGAEVASGTGKRGVVVEVYQGDRRIKLPDGKMGVCPKVSVDLSLVRESNGMKRVVASSPDGQIVGAVDIPVETAAPIEDHPWAVGASYNPTNQTGGIWVERDIGRIRVGVDLNQSRPNLAAPMGTEVRIRAGWTF